jgi:hypothetical protein
LRDVETGTKMVSFDLTDSVESASAGLEHRRGYLVHQARGG